MDWLNLYGLAFIIVIMIPNVIFAVKNKSGLTNVRQNKAVLVFEQIGRFGCIAFMIIKTPWFGFASDKIFAAYLIINSALVLAYCAVWAVNFRKNRLLRAILLSAMPSAVFLFSALLSRSVVLGIFSMIFAPSHILISCKNARMD